MRVRLHAQLLTWQKLTMEKALGTVLVKCIQKTFGQNFQKHVQESGMQFLSDVIGFME